MPAEPAATRSSADPVALDKEHSWHPFTQMQAWCAPEHEPLVLVEGSGAWLVDAQGRKYLDGNSSIWTNLHGHRHSRLDAALRRQLERVAHTSFLGFTNPPAAELAKALVDLWPGGDLSRVFFSDNGSTAIEVALKMAAQYWQQNGQPERRRFVAFEGAYHGDTMGASSLGGIGVFHSRFSAWQFPAEHVDSLEALAALDPHSIAAVVIEPLIQGANQMRLWPPGLLAGLRRWCTEHDVFLIVDEVMTGFGRTGTMFACEQERVLPDFVALAKGLTGGYLPLAATLTTERVFSAFLGDAGRTLYYGHSYTGNQLGCALALENLAIFREEEVLERVRVLIAAFSTHLEDLRTRLRDQPCSIQIRQCGLIAGIELRDSTGAPFPPAEALGTKVCLAARSHGLLTRPIRDTIVLMPPYCISNQDLAQMVHALGSAVQDTFGAQTH